jgi:hypothetical protein
MTNKGNRTIGGAFDAADVPQSMALDEKTVAGRVEHPDLGQSVMRALVQVPTGVQDVIAKALRTADLLK